MNPFEALSPEEREKRVRDVEDIIGESYDHIRSQLLNPNVRGPISDPNIETAQYSFLTGSITYNPFFIAEMAMKEGLADSAEAMATGIFAHEMGHHLVHPIHKHIHLYLAFNAKTLFGEDGPRIHHLFTDFSDNTLINRVADIADLERLLTTCYADSESVSMLAYYRALELTIGREEYEDEKRYSKNSLPIPTKMRGETAKKYAAIIEETAERIFKLGIVQRHKKPSERAHDLRMEKIQLQQFGKILQPLIDIDKQNDANTQPNMSLSNSHSADPSTKEMPGNIRKIIWQEIQKLGPILSREEYEAIKNHYFPGEKQSKSGRGNGIGLDEASTGRPSAETKEYYREICQVLGIYTPPLRLPGRTTERMLGVRRTYQAGDSLTHIDTVLSGGRIIPGITTRKEEIDISVMGMTDSNPTLLLYKDVSGSMRNPQTEKDPITIATILLALSRIRAGSPVLVSLFDGAANNLVHVPNEDAALEELCSYKGGGTHLDIERIKKDVEKGILHTSTDDITMENLRIHGIGNEKIRQYVRKNAVVHTQKPLGAVDLVIVTDGGIANIGEIIQYAKENSQLRPMIMHTGGYDLGIPGYDGKTNGRYEGIGIWHVSDFDDVINAAKSMQLLMIYGEE